MRFQAGRRALFTGLVWVCLADPSFAARIAIIGTGEVGSALGQSFARAGHEIIYGSREPQRPELAELVARSGADASIAGPAAAAAQADIVVLAVPWYAVEATTRSLGDLAGKVVIDPSNPRSEGPNGRDYAYPEGSNAERIQAIAPQARVVKAFNTLGADKMADPASAGGPVTIPLVGDDTAAKAEVASLIREIGLESADLGPLRYARIIEGWYLVRSYAAEQGHPFDLYFRPATE
jgi:NADPH-dependent F420 reductase